MSRKKFKLTDFDKYLKPIHLGGKEQTYTVSHIGTITQPPRQRENVFAGNNPEELERVPELVPVLHFRQIGKPMKLTQATNRAKLAEYIGEQDIDVLVGADLTLVSMTNENFGREFVGIKAVKMPSKPVDPAPYRTGRIQQLSKLRTTEKGLLAEKNIEQKALTLPQVNAMTIEQIEELIELTESNIVDLQAARVTNIE